jgi:hypothetical protein
MAATCTMPADQAGSSIPQQVLLMVRRADCTYD